MVQAIRKRVRVQPGGRVEIQDDALPEGADVEILLFLPETTGDGAPASSPETPTDRSPMPLDEDGLPILAPVPERSGYTLADMIGACPTGRTAEEIDRELRELRDEWD